MPLFTPPTRRHRLIKTAVQINAEFVSRETPVITIMNDFIDTTTVGTFDELYAQLTPELQEDLRVKAQDSIPRFDAIMVERRERGVYLDGWLAFREWTTRQPWYADAQAQAGSAATSAGELETLRQKYSEQGATLGRLRVEQMRAQTDDERDAIKQRIADLEREFAKINADD